jgi:hypothetical protein
MSDYQTPLERFIEALGPDAKVKHLGGGQYEALCPAHEDENASLSFRAGDDQRLLLNCHAGCETLAVLKARGLTWKDLFPRGGDSRSAPDPVPKEPKPAYVPRDAAQFLYYRLNPQTLELEQAFLHVKRGRGENKKVWWVHWADDGQLMNGRNGQRAPLYRWPDARLAVLDGNGLVFLTEGEADAEAATELGLVACSVPDGADSLNKRDKAAELLRPLRGADVVVLPDNDEPGLKMASAVVRQLEGVARSVRVLELPGLGEGGDLDDWLRAGGDLEQLVPLVADAPLGREWPKLLDPPEAVDPEVAELLAAAPLVTELWADPELLKPEAALVNGLAYPGRLVMLAAPEKLGKSTLLSDAVAALSNGAPFLGGDTEPGLVLWLGYEEPTRDPLRRFHARGLNGDLARVMRYPLDHGQALKLIEHQRPVWVLIDSLVKWGEVADKPVENWGSSAQAGPVVNHLADLAHGYIIEGYAPAVTFTHHVVKGGNGYRDSSAIGAAVDLIAEMRRPGKDDSSPHRLIEYRGRFTVEANPLSIVWGPRGYGLADQTVEVPGHPAGVDLALVAELLAEVRSDPGRGFRAICRALGKGDATLRPALKYATEGGLLEYRGEGPQRGLWLTPTALAEVVGDE